MGIASSVVCVCLCVVDFSRIREFRMKGVLCLCFIVLLQYCAAQMPEGRPGCVEAPVQGMCKGRFLRWYFDAASAQCREFFYGGCDGIANNYKTKTDCMINCIPI